MLFVKNDCVTSYPSDITSGIKNPIAPTVKPPIAARIQKVSEILEKIFLHNCKLLANNIEIKPVNAPRTKQASKEVMENPAIS